VASLALQLSQNHMTAMGEEDVVGLRIDPFPRDLFTSFLELPDLFLFGALGDGFFVAVEADFDSRDSGEGLGLVITVTGIAGLSLLDMLLVIERDGLFGF